MYWIKEKGIVCPKCNMRFKYEYREYTDFGPVAQPVEKIKCPACSCIIKEGKDIRLAVFLIGLIIILLTLVLYMIYKESI